MTPQVTQNQPTPKKSKPPKSAPERTCIGCRKRRPTRDLVRFAKFQGQVLFGRDIPGRGAWLCTETVLDCLKTARTRKAIGRALKEDVTAAQLDRLSEALSGPKDSG